MAARPFDVQRLDHVVLRVLDLERSEAFHRAVLGCEVVPAATTWACAICGPARR